MRFESKLRKLTGFYNPKWDKFGLSRTGRAAVAWGNEKKKSLQKNTASCIKPNFAILT
jgi:PIN domain nuclease of toxin-antitoxin system